MADRCSKEVAGSKHPNMGAKILKTDVAKAKLGGW